MRKKVFALGVCVLFLGVVLTSSSGMLIKPEPQGVWALVKDVTAPAAERVEHLFVEGNLTTGDKFRVIFSLAPPPSGRISLDTEVLINLTDPIGHTDYYEIPIERADGSLGTEAPLPEGVANYTGTYKVNAETIWGIYLIRLALRKWELQESESYYPYRNFFLPGLIVLLGGVSTSLLGVKTSGKRKRFRVPKSEK